MMMMTITGPGSQSDSNGFSRTPTNFVPYGELRSFHQDYDSDDDDDDDGDEDDDDDDDNIFDVYYFPLHFKQFLMFHFRLF